MSVRKNLNILIKDSILFGIAIGLNRGTSFFVFPLLLRLLSVEEFGIFTLVVSVSQLLIPVLNVSLTTGIIREGSSNPQHGLYLLKKVFFIPLTMVLLITLFLIPFSVADWIRFSLYLAFSSVIYELILSFVRSQDNKKLYFLVSLIKSSFFIGVICIAYLEGLKLNELVTFLILIQILISNIVFWILYVSFAKKISPEFISLNKVINYTVFVIPHGLAIWAMNSSDKLFIKYFLAEYDLGIYSLVYTIASVQLLVNGGLSTALPYNVYRNYTEWRSPEIRKKGLILFGLISTLLNLIVIIVLKMKIPILNLPNDTSQILHLLSFIVPGLFLLGIYQFYSIFVFHNRQTRRLFLLSIFCALINVSLNYIFLQQYGITAAAVITLITYILFVVGVMGLTLKIDKNLKDGLVVDISISLIFVFIINKMYTLVFL